MALTEAARALVERRDRERLERWEGTRPMFDTARTKGSFLLAEPGCEVWGRFEGDISRQKLKDELEPRGGIILEITSDMDGEGEIKRAFRTIDYDPRVPIWRAVTVLTEEQVNPDSFTGPDVARIRRMWRRLCGEVHSKTGIASKAEIDMVRDAFLLSAIVRRTVA